MDLLEKVGTKTLFEHAPDVAMLYSRFSIDNSAQESMLAAMDSGLSAMQAACGWIRKEENAGVWGAWLPVATGNVSMVPVDDAIVDMSTHTVDLGTWVLLGAGAAAALLVAGLMLLAWKRRAHLQAIMTMLFTEVSGLVGCMGMDIADLATDGIAWFRLLHDEFKVPNEGYRLAYATIFCCGAVTTLVSVVWRMRNARLIREQVAALGDKGKQIRTGAGANDSGSNGSPPSAPVHALRARMPRAPPAPSHSVHAGKFPKVTDNSAADLVAQSASKGTSSPSSDDMASLNQARRQERQYVWELDQTDRSKVTAVLALTSACVQGGSRLQDFARP
jgi:hypothetical protein